MRKLNYKIKAAIIGKKSIGENIILNYLKQMAMDTPSLSNNGGIINIVHDSIPIKIHVKLYETMNDLLYDTEFLNGLNFLFLAISIYDQEAFNNYKKEEYIEVCTSINFKGSSLLVVVDMDSTNDLNSSEKVRISRLQFIRKCNELDLEYCFEITDPEEDLSELFIKILNDSNIKLKISNPELYEKVKGYGKELSKKKI